MVGIGGILQLDGFEPGIFPGRLVEVAGEADFVTDLSVGLDEPGVGARVEELLPLYREPARSPGTTSGQGLSTLENAAAALLPAGYSIEHAGSSISLERAS